MLTILFLAGIISQETATPAGTRLVAAADTTTVRGTVFDSLAMSPMAGALVQMAPADSSTTSRYYAAKSDSAGRFAISGIPSGKYIIGFYHVTLDTLGIELRNRLITVTSREFVTTLGTPSAATLATTLCSIPDSSSSSTPSTVTSSTPPTLLIGHVRNIRTEAVVESASVNFSWADLEDSKDGLAIVDRQATAQTYGTGFFAVCGLPSDVLLSAFASHGTDSSGHVALRVPTAGFLHVTLAIGTSGRSGRVVGRVTDAAKRPVRTAQVTIGDRTVATRANGSFVLDSVGAGTQSIEIRALGYAPKLSVLQVADDRETEFVATLERVVTLDAVVSNESAAAANLAQYLREKRTDATGARFVEPDRIPGYKSQQPTCQLVSAATRINFCRINPPGCGAIFVNGTQTNLTIDDIDPDDIIGVEGFGHARPARYADFKGVCPFVIWTRCAGSTIPTCGDNPASKPIVDRPKIIDRPIGR